jgi:hypothetical protein
MIDKIKAIKYSRLNDNERYLIGLCNDTIPFKHKQYPNSIFYIKDNSVLFEIYRDISNDILYLDTMLIWDNAARNFIIPEKKVGAVTKIISDFFTKNYDTKNFDINIRHKENKSWKHIVRYLNSIDRKSEYVK